MSAVVSFVWNLALSQGSEQVMMLILVAVMNILSLAVFRLAIVFPLQVALGVENLSVTNVARAFRPVQTLNSSNLECVGTG